MTEVIMPKMGDGMEEGTLIEWLKKEGDKVKTGDVIGTIQTDKATLELESPGSGVLQGFLLQGGETVPVGKPIAAILKAGEELPSGWGSAAAAPAQAAPAPETKQEEAASAPGNGEATIASARVKASPLARKIAAEKGIDLGLIKGSGPGGRIVEKDILSAGPEGTPTTAPAAAPQPIATTAEDKTIQLNRMRQITAKRTVESKQQVPHFYVTVEVDVERILVLREMFEAEQSGKVSINDFVVRACALALRDMPEVNAVYQGNNLVQLGGVHVGIAVALPDGLTVPVIRNADQLSLRQISGRAKELASKARDNKLGLEELTGSTFAISNMGMLDVDNFVAIINQPNAAIVAIASVRKKPVVGP
ncbi:MAG TPA: dihydrolipoamide acetyltransferase family protein, partial [Fimbriimonas sp.]|nr:dihydrolipoamide acetyltransferase family protein [Fimbriimonas sp.]